MELNHRFSIIQVITFLTSYFSMALFLVVAGSMVGSQLIKAFISIYHIMLLKSAETNSKQLVPELHTDSALPYNFTLALTLSIY